MMFPFKRYLQKNLSSHLEFPESNNPLTIPIYPMIMQLTASIRTYIRGKSMNHINHQCKMTLQCKAPKIAKLVYSYNSRGLW